MSVITNYTVKSSTINLRNALKEAYAVGPGTMYSPRRKGELSYDNLLDYKVCPEYAEKRKAEVIERNPGAKEWSDKKWDDTYLRVPVTFSDDGMEMYWFTNYSYDDTPSIVVGKLFPDEVFYISAVTESELDFATYFKGMQNTTKDGTPYETTVSRMHGIYKTEQGETYMTARIGEDAEHVCVPVNEADLIPYTEYPDCDTYLLTMQTSGEKITAYKGRPDENGNFSKSEPVEMTAEEFESAVTKARYKVELELEEELEKE